MIKLFFLMLCFLATPIQAEEHDMSICNLSKNIVCGASSSIQKLGVLANGYTVYRYLNVFGESHRAAKRMIFLNERNEYLGMYATPELGERIEGNCVLFPLPEAEGNRICVSDGMLPKIVWLGGENPELFH